MAHVDSGDTRSDTDTNARHRVNVDWVMMLSTLPISSQGQSKYLTSLNIAWLGMQTVPFLCSTVLMPSLLAIVRPFELLTHRDDGLLDSSLRGVGESLLPL